MRKWMFFILSVCMIFTLAACNSETSPSGSAQEIGVVGADSTRLEGLDRRDSSVSNPPGAIVTRLDIPQNNADATVSNTSENDRVRLSFNGNEIIVTMYDNPASRDFLSMLPLTLTFEDFNNKEKISNLPRNLVAEGAPPAIDPVAGDFTYFAPWGNLAIFYKNHKSSNHSLKSLGRIDSGTSLLADMNGKFEVTIEKVD